MSMYTQTENEYVDVWYNTLILTMLHLKLINTQPVRSWDQSMVYARLMRYKQ